MIGEQFRLLGATTNLDPVQETVLFTSLDASLDVLRASVSDHIQTELVSKKEACVELYDFCRVRVSSKRDTPTLWISVEPRTDALEIRAGRSQ